MGLTELILYACPTGPLGDAVDHFFAKVADRPTTAQAYPPHCTLTGFFHDDVTAVPRYVAAAAIAASNRLVDVEVVALRTEHEWIGLELRSADLESIAIDFRDRAGHNATRADEIRVKDWPHVSLAYGHRPDDHAPLAAFATRIVDPAAAAGWDLRLYERSGNDWVTHGSWPLANRP